MSFISNLFNRKPVSVVGIDIGSSSIKVVQLARKGGRAILETYGELALGPYAGTEIGRATNLPPEKLSEALRDVLRESKITTSNAALAIPFSSSLITTLEMPAVSEKQMAQIIPLEARKFIPVPINEVALDWWMVPKAEEKGAHFGDDERKAIVGEKTDVLVVAIHNDTLRKYQTIISQANLSASFFEIEIFSAIRSVIDEQVQTQMIIDMGAASTKMYITERGVVRSSHIVTHGSQEITLALARALNASVQDAEVMKRDLTQVPAEYRKDVDSVVSVSLDHIFSEAQRILLGYQRKYNKDIPKVILVGGGARLMGLMPYAEAQLQTGITFGDPFNKVDAPAFLAEVLKQTGPEFAVSVGVALRKLSEVE